MTGKDFLRLHLDLEHLHQISDDSPEFELELLQIFIEDSQTHLEALKRAIAANDLYQVERIAHHIKGASANVGANMMQLCAEQLEERSRQNRLENTENTKDLVSELERSLNQIQEFVDSQNSLL